MGFALMARYFLLLAQEKVPKEKGTRALIGLRRCPAFLDNQGVRRTRYAQTTAPLIPDCLRYSVSADGSGMDVLILGVEFPRLAQPSIAVKSG